MPADILTPFGNFGVSVGVDKDIVELLENALMEGRRGEIAGIAMTVVMPNGCIKSDMRRGNRSMAEMVGAVSSLKDDILFEWKPR